ncbi:pericentrin isoform X4 [Nothobranchius furzeri]|uniref:pericentrin isoform X4 n=1 Tax=Nothobranchius furzeri TaxID=105023 RepID=UPI003904D39C
MDEDERQRKLEAGRAKKSSNIPRSRSLASFRQKRAKSDSAGTAKKTQKRKGQTVSKNDNSTQDRNVEPAPLSARATGPDESGHEEAPEKSEVQQKKHQEDLASSSEQNSSPLEDLRAEELAALTGKEHLEQLQEAVEKRNEIIAKLSYNLQEALVSRDQVQLEAQSLAGQIQALQKQIQQASVDFLRIKGPSGPDVCRDAEHHPDFSSQLPNIIDHKEGTSTESGKARPGGLSSDSNAVVLKLMTELEEERKNSRRKSEELAKETEKHQHVLLLLEEERRGREEEWKEREAHLQSLQIQLSQVQTECLEMQQHKEEKEKLNKEVLQLRKKLQVEEDAERRFSEEVANSALRLQALEEEKLRQQEEMKELKEEVEHFRQLLDESGRELKKREEEVEGLKASKNHGNRAKAGFSAERISADESLPGDLLMERYLSSAPPAHSGLNESFGRCSELDVSADCSFELNSDVFGDQPLLSISNRVYADDQSVVSSQDRVPEAVHSSLQSLSQWPHNSTSAETELSQMSERQFGEMDLEKQLLNQQCEEFREELALKERDLGVLREELMKSAEELEEARRRWGQVTEELRQALWELEEEKEQRRRIEEEMDLKSHESESLVNKVGALLDEMENEDADMSPGREAETSMLVLPSSQSQEGDKLVGEVNEGREEDVTLSSHLNQQEDETSSDFAKDATKTGDDVQIEAVQAHCQHLVSKLEETESEQETTSALLSQKLMELSELSRELETAHERVSAVQSEVEGLQQELLQSRNALEQAEKEKAKLESEMSTLRKSLVQLEDAQAQSVKQREEDKRKEQQMDEQIKKMEQVLEEELEQFENMLKAKDVELAEEREKWEEEKQEKEKLLGQVKEKEEEVKSLSEQQLLAVEEATAKLNASHQQEMKDLMEKHHQEVSELKAHMETKLLEQQVRMEEEQKRQISLIKQVTEREHERMTSELNAKHEEELHQLRTDVALELRESMEAAHQAELQQAQAQKSLEFEALRLSLTTVHMSQLEQDSALSPVQLSRRETLTVLPEAHQEERGGAQKLQPESEELKQQWEIFVPQDRGLMEEWHKKEIQAVGAQWETEAERDAQKSVEIQNSLNATQTELSSTQASLAETSAALGDARAALSQTQSELEETKTRLQELQTSTKVQIHKLEEELKLAWNGDAASQSLEELVCTHKSELQEKEQQVHHLEEKQQHLQQEVLRLEEEKVSLKQSWEQEVGQLWAQLESMRTSRQELGELREQLLARSSHVNDIECLKTEFNEQKREIKAQNEAELENLRSYFEKRLRASEESYKEEIALLQLRLVESALEESVLKTTDDDILSQAKAEEDKEVRPEKPKELLELEDQHALDHPSLQTSLTLSFNDELEQVRSDLTDHYYIELQEMKTRHALELQQLGAKLSDSHVEELTRIHLEAARQVEAEVEQRTWYLTEQLQTRMTIIHTLENRLTSLSERRDAEMQSNTQKLNLVENALKEERGKLKEELQLKHANEMSALKLELDGERGCLEMALQEEKEKFRSLQVDLDRNENPQVLMLRQRLEAEYEGELQKAKDCMSAEIKKLSTLMQEQSLAQQRLQEEKAALEQHLVQKHQTALAELKNIHEAELQRERTTLLNKHATETNDLTAKHKEQLESLSASLRVQFAAVTAELETNLNAQLVAAETALDSKRKEELEALEADLARKHQEEKDELEKRMLGNMDTLETTYLKEVQVLRDEIVQLKERHHQDLAVQSAEHTHLMEELRKELAQVHVEKFRAMAAELNHLHRTELAVQKQALDTEHCKALETLKKQVLELEHQHSTALQELSQSYAAEKQQLLEQQQIQLQELKGTSARELEACRRELEEESSRQRQHFLEEAELLKVQSDERLQDRINQVKTDFDEQKEAELEEARRSFTAEQQEKEQSYTSKMSQLTAQLQQLDAVVAQLRAEVGCLQEELQGKRVEMETLDTILQRRERESQEGGNLLKMLTDDLHAAKEEKCRLQNANEKLSKVLIEMLRGVIATEDLIGQKINTRTTTGEQVTHRSSENKDIQESDLTSEEAELTQLLCESLLVSDSQISPAGEESALNACSRLRHAVDTLLDLLNQANAQLEQTRNVHLSLEEKFSQGREDTTQLLEQHRLLMKQLDQEAKLKTQLQLELHKAEGLLGGYVAEKAALEESLQQKEAQEEKLVEEVEGLKLKLHQLQTLTVELESLRAKHQELSEEHTLLLRQKEHLSAGLGEREKALLAETERLIQDRLDLQRQAEKDHGSLSQRLRALERELEDHQTKDVEKELHHQTHTEDLSQQVQALEKQLKHDRQFIEEQAVEREHERDEFQQEILRLEARLRQTTAVDHKGHKFEDLILQVESLQAVLKDKTEDHASLLAANQQAQRDLAERNEEIDKLAGRIRELEQALLGSAERLRTVSQLEQELHRAKLREQELTRDKLALEQQQLSSRLQISALQSKLDETRHCYHDNTQDPTQELRDALDTAQQNLLSKEQEVGVLVVQLEDVQRDLALKEAELKHLTLQLELLTNKSTVHAQELQEEISFLNEKVLALTRPSEEKEEPAGMEEPDEHALPAALLQEKNQEIDHLNCEIQRLEQELENSADHKALKAELEDLHSQVEHLQAEITRVRHEKQEEVERLHEVISTLQAELATLGPNLHEVSDSQDGDSINPSPAPSPEPYRDHVPEQEGRGKPKSLKHELSLTNTASLWSRLKALQSQFEMAVAEKEGLERLLLTQEEEYRRQGEEFGKRLKVEREKSDEIQGFLTLKEVELEELKAKLEDERNHWKVQVEEKARLDSLVLDLQNNEKDTRKEIEMLKTTEKEMRQNMEVLGETSLTLERQVQETRAEGRDRIQTLETVNGELSAERDALRNRESQLQEEIEKLRQEVTSLKVLVQELTAKAEEKETNQEQEDLTHADVTLAKADTALRLREAEFSKLRTEYETLRTELTAMKQGLSSTTKKTESFHDNKQTKDQYLVDLETENNQLKAELQHLQEDLALQEEKLAYQRRELQELHQWRHQSFPQRDVSHLGFEDGLTISRDEASLSSPEVLRRLDCSEDRIRERFQTSALDSRLFELSGMNNTSLDPPQDKTSPRVAMEPPRSRTITPDPETQSSHSPKSLSGSDNFSVLNSVEAEKELEGLDLTAPPSPLGSTSSLSAQEWNTSDGYGSNVSSELGARLRVELEQTERLDAQFVQYLRCRGMNPTANTDSAAGSMSYCDDLSPELQDLLKKVYQESCRILTLSQRGAAPSAHPRVFDLKAFPTDQTRRLSTSGDRGDKAPSPDPPMSWQQEKRALQETVIALRELLCRMAQRNTQSDYIDDDWHRRQLQTDGQVESQLRAELEENQNQLKCSHNALQEQKNKILSLRLTAEEGEEALRREQTKVKELQKELEQERALILRRDKEEEERREAAHVSHEKHRSEVNSLKGQVEQEMVAFSNLKQELQIEQSRSSLLEKCLEDTHKAQEDERQRFAHQQELCLQEKSQIECLLHEAESRLTEIHSKLADSHKRVDEERDRWSRQVDELSRRHEADAARDQNFILELRSQLDQERRQEEELAAVVNKLRTELLQSRRRWEEEDKTRREQLQREQEAVSKYRVLVETLKEQKQDITHALEAEREQSRRHGVELVELKEMVRLLKEKEREREDQVERERRRGRQEQKDREIRQERTNKKLLELEMLRQLDQRRMQELQYTLTELERDEREMVAQRLSGSAPGQQLEAAPASVPRHSNSPADRDQTATSQPRQQVGSTPSSSLLESLLKENSTLTEQVTSLSRERTTYKNRLTCVEKQLRRAENELAKVAAETENRPVNDATSNSRLQRYYERYLRAESFRKALVYQKRYLLLLLGGFQDCEEATLCLIARMGARPSPPLTSQRKPLRRFRAAVRAVIAVFRMRFLTRKWQRAIRRLPYSGTANGHAPAGPKAEVLRQQQPRSNSDPTQVRDNSNHGDGVFSIVPSSKSFRWRSRLHSDTTLSSGGTSQDPERSLTEYIHHLEKVQQRLVGTLQGSSDPK